jgi:hypothetical protein
MARERYCGKRTRELIKHIERLGGTVELTASGHLRVTGPTGVMVVGSRHGRPDRRSDLNIRSILRQATGLDLGRVTASGRTPGRAATTTRGAARRESRVR